MRSEAAVQEDQELLSKIEAAIFDAQYRDAIALEAMKIMLQRNGLAGDEAVDYLAEDAYDVADAMIAARAR
jgi:hypothetical protein